MTEIVNWVKKGETWLISFPQLPRSFEIQI